MTFLGYFLMFQALNFILVTSTELFELRLLLKQSLVNAAGKDLFVSLYSSWCHSSVAALSLCLLAQVGILSWMYNCTYILCKLLTSSNHFFISWFVIGISTCKLYCSFFGGRRKKCKILHPAGQVDPPSGDSSLCLPKIAGAYLSLFLVYMYDWNLRSNSMLGSLLQICLSIFWIKSKVLQAWFWNPVPMLVLVPVGIWMSLCRPRQTNIAGRR